jgi:hypothetical protein
MALLHVTTSGGHLKVFVKARSDQTSVGTPYWFGRHRQKSRIGSVPPVDLCIASPTNSSDGFRSVIEVTVVTSIDMKS